MSKKVRGPVRSQRRSGSRQNPSRSNAATQQRPQPSQLEAAEIIAEDMIDERPAEAAAELETVARTVPARPGMRTKPGSLLAARAASEYIYVAQDMRRILIVAGMLFGTLFLLWLLIVQLRIIPVQFY
jgi:hypothetical protein